MYPRACNCCFPLTSANVWPLVPLCPISWEGGCCCVTVASQLMWSVGGCLQLLSAAPHGLRSGAPAPLRCAPQLPHRHPAPTPLHCVPAPSAPVLDSSSSLPRPPPAVPVLSSSSPPQCPPENLYPFPHANKLRLPPGYRWCLSRMSLSIISLSLALSSIPLASGLFRLSSSFLVSWASICALATCFFSSSTSVSRSCRAMSSCSLPSLMSCSCCSSIEPNKSLKSWSYFY